MTIFLFCGLIIGAVMGLTGGGGALVAIPLFIHLLSMTLTQASTYSLVAVVASSLFNFLFQKSETNYKLSLAIILSSVIGSLMGVAVKAQIPEFVAAVLLALVSGYSLFHTWFFKQPENLNSGSSEFNLSLAIIIGIGLGALTTLTGLGGGILLMPIFIRFFQFTQNKAVATSLLVVSFSSLLSLIFQILSGYHFELNLELLFLFCGILGAAFVVKLALRFVPTKKLILLRKVTFTIVVALAIAKII